jgi:hypothetical protein
MTRTLIPERAAPSEWLAAAPPISVEPSATVQQALRWSAALAIVAAIAGAIGGFLPAVFHDAPVTVGNARGTALVILFVALPVLIASMRLASRGSRRARIVWLGTLAYLAYNSAIFAFGAVFNALFFVYVAMLSLSVWSIVALTSRIDVAEMPSWFHGRLPVRAVGSYLIVTTVAFAGLWLADVVPALVANTAPASLRGTRFITNPIEVLDFAFTIPLSVLGGVWLWRRRPLGYLLAGTFLVMLTIEAVSVATDQWFGHLHDPTQPLGTVPLFVVMTLVGLVPTIAFLRDVKESDRTRTPAGLRSR